MSKYRPPEYFLSCIHDYIEKEFKESLLLFKNTQNQVEFSYELKFVLGSVLAPKRMMMIYKDSLM